MHNSIKMSYAFFHFKQNASSIKGGRMTIKNFVLSATVASVFALTVPVSFAACPLTSDCGCPDATHARQVQQQAQIADAMLQQIVKKQNNLVCKLTLTLTQSTQTLILQS